MSRCFTAFILVFSVHALGAPLGLDQLIAMARKNDGRVKEAEAQLRWFQAKYSEAKWAWFPKIDATFLVAGPTPEARNDGLGGPPTTAATTMYDSNFGRMGIMLRAEAQGVVPIFTFGKLTALRQMGLHGVELGQYLKRRSEDEAELQVLQAYTGYQLARSGKATLEETLKRLSDAVDALKKLRENDSAQVTQVDEYRLQYYIAQTRARLAFAETGAETAREAVRLLVGMKPEAPLDIVSEDLRDVKTRPRPISAYVEAAFETRPELLALNAGLKLRENEVALNRSMFLPDLGLAGFARWAWTSSTTRQISPFAYDPFHDLSAGVGLVGRYSFDIPQKAARLAEAQAEFDKLREQKNLAEGAIRLEVQRTYGELVDALSRQTNQSDAEKYARKWATASFAAFEVGTGETREIIESFIALAIAAAEHMKAVHDVKVAFAALKRACGQAVDGQPVSVRAGPPN